MPPGMTRPRRLRRGGAVVIAALGLVVAVAACGGGHPAAPRPAAAASAPGLELPASGAVLGAYVGVSGSQQPAARIAAFEALQARTGQPLSLVHTYHTWTSSFPDAADTWAVSSGHGLLLSWNSTDTRTITAGTDDAMIATRARALAALKAPVLLEYRWEMDRPDLTSTLHSPQDYIAAWDHIRAIFRQQGASNVGFVWCPTASGFEKGRAAQWYPGDSEVDWLCADDYAGPSYQPLSTTLAPFLTWAASHPKPILLGEIGADVDAAGDQAAWVRALLTEAPAMPQIRAYVFFDDVYTDSGGQTSDLSFDTSSSVAALAQLQRAPYFRSPGASR